MSDFEEYIKNKYPEDYAVLSTMYSNQAMEELYPDQFEVWQHQQSKVDELQKKNVWLSEVAVRENKRANNLQQDKTSTTILLGKTIQEKNELQKRINEALEDLEYPTAPWDETISSVVKVLRGES